MSRRRQGRLRCAVGRYKQVPKWERVKTKIHIKLKSGRVISLNLLPGGVVENGVVRGRKIQKRTVVYSKNMPII